MNKKIRNIILSFLLTIIFISILLTNISIKSLFGVFLNYNLKIILIAFSFHLLAYLLRTLVFYTFLKKKLKISFFYLLNIHFIHNFYVHIIPASLGEMSFPILLKRKIQPEKSFSVLFISRMLFLLLTLILFFIALVLNFNLLPNFKMDLIKYLYLFLLIIPLAIFYYYRKKFLISLNKILLFQKIIGLIKRTLDNIKTDLILLKNPVFLSYIILSTCLNIVALTLTYFFILKGMDLHLSFFQIIFVSSIGIAFILLPIKSIGGFGTTEGAWALGMLILGFKKEIAIESGFAIHLIALLNVIIMFFLGLIIKGLIYRN